MSTLSAPSPSHILRNNFRALYADIFGYGILAGSTLAFLNVYVARLGASNIDMGLLSAGPALISLLLSMPISRWLERHPLIRATYLSSIWFRLGYVIMIFLPWLLAASLQVWSYVLVVLLMSVPGTFLAIGFSATLVEVVPPDWRAHVIGRRNALMAFSMTVTALICGQLLDGIRFPLNYQIVFAIGAAGAGLSTIYLGRIRPIGLKSAPAVIQPVRSTSSQALRIDLLRGPFGPLLGAYLLFYLAQAVPVPLFDGCIYLSELLAGI